MNSHLVTGVEATAAALAIIVTGGSIAKWVLPFFRRVVQFLDDWNGEPARAGVSARPGMLERMSSVEAQQETTAGEASATREEVKKQLVSQEKRTAAILADFDVRLGDMQEQLEVVHHEVRPNGGWSIKDQINRLDPALDDDGKPKT